MKTNRRISSASQKLLNWGFGFALAAVCVLGGERRVAAEAAADSRREMEHSLPADATISVPTRSRRSATRTSRHPTSTGLSTRGPPSPEPIAWARTRSGLRAVTCHDPDGPHAFSRSRRPREPGYVAGGLRPQGYTTFLTGKWHNKPASALRTFQKGKAIFFGGMGNPYSLRCERYLFGT